MKEYLIGTTRYPSIAEASRLLGFNAKSLGTAFSCGRSTYKGLIIDILDDREEEPDEPRISCPAVDSLLERLDRTHHGGLMGRTEVMR